MKGEIELVEFGKNKLPDKVLIFAEPSDIEGMEGGHGLCIFALNNPGTISWNGSIETANQIGAPIVGLWFYREESIDAVIRSLQGIKKRFRNDDSVCDVNP